MDVIEGLPFEDEHDRLDVEKTSALCCLPGEAHVEVDESVMCT